MALLTDEGACVVTDSILLTKTEGEWRASSNEKLYRLGKNTWVAAAATNLSGVQLSPPSWPGEEADTFEATVEAIANRMGDGISAGPTYNLGIVGTPARRLPQMARVSHDRGIEYGYCGSVFLGGGARSALSIAPTQAPESLSDGRDVALGLASRMLRAIGATLGTAASLRANSPQRQAPSARAGSNAPTTTPHYLAGMAPFLEAGGWDVWVAVIGALPALVGLTVLVIGLIVFWPQIKQRLGTADIDIEFMGSKVKLSAATANLGNTVADLQNRVRQLAAELDDRLKPQAAVPDEPAIGAAPAQEEVPEGGGGKGAGPGGPRPGPRNPGSLLWIDPNPDEHLIERVQLMRAGWVLHLYPSIDVAAMTFSGPTNIEARAIVVVLTPDVALTDVLAKLPQLPSAQAFVYHSSLSQVAPTMAVRHGVFVTASATELLSALTETRCGQCGLLQPEPGSLRADRRRPCPNCGSLSRQFSRSVSE